MNCSTLSPLTHTLLYIQYSYIILLVLICSCLFVTVVVSSALSGMVARIPLHPIDTIKAQLQVQYAHTQHTHTQYTHTTKHTTTSFTQAFMKTYRVEGIRGLYAGFGIAFLGSAPAACLYFT